MKVKKKALAFIINQCGELESLCIQQCHVINKEILEKFLAKGSMSLKKLDLCWNEDLLSNHTLLSISNHCTALEELIYLGNEDVAFVEENLEANCFQIFCGSFKNTLKTLIFGGIRSSTIEIIISKCNVLETLKTPLCHLKKKKIWKMPCQILERNYLHI